LDIVTSPAVTSITKTTRFNVHLLKDSSRGTAIWRQHTPFISTSHKCTQQLPDVDWRGSTSNRNPCSL